MPVDEFAIADLVMVAVILVSALFGLLRGFVKEVVALVIWCAAFVLSMAFGPPLGQLVVENLDERLQAALGIGAVFVAVLVIGAIVQRILQGLVKGSGLSGTDRTLGLVFGGVRGVTVVVLGLIVLRSYTQESAWWEESQLAGPLLVYEDDVLAITSALKESLQGWTGDETPAVDETLAEEAV